MRLKNKGVIFSIIFILCTGVFVTNYTRRLVSSGTAFELPMEEKNNAASTAGIPEAVLNQVEAGAPMEARGGTEAQIAMKARGAMEPQAEGEAQSTESQAFMETQAAPALLSADEEMPMGAAVFSAPAAAPQENQGQELEKNTGSSVVISPLTGAADITAKKEAAFAPSSEDYRKKLQDIEAQIKKMKDSGVEPSTDSYKNIADYEYRLWDNELNTIYQDIIGKMTVEEADALRAEEREWMKVRDQIAHKAIAKYNGGTVESLEYTASMAETTRARAYELLENYGSYLDFFLTQERE